MELISANDKASFDCLESTKNPATEDILNNGISRQGIMTICIPAYRTSADALLQMLCSMQGAAACSLLIFDDGSCDRDLSSKLKFHVLNFPGSASLITSSENIGRSRARNRLQFHAISDWLLFLDADMLPDDGDFLLKYLHAVSDAPEPILVAGGFSLKQVEIRKEAQLHAAQSLRSECLSAKERSMAPGRYVFTSNILVHRSILTSISFDVGFVGWGWEDVDWGLRVAKHFRIQHIDNPATHLGLDNDDVLIEKYEGSGRNFARLFHRNREVMSGTPLYRMSALLARLPGTNYVKYIGKFLANQRYLPVGLRLYALKLFRAAAYAEHLG